MQNYRASSEDFINIKVKETDSICKSNYRGNLEKPIKENIKLSDRKRKENPWVIELSRYLIALKKEMLLFLQFFQLKHVR